ncbi:MAG TPA: DOMON-like domain-containing protein [Caulobacteraceae bacterium]|nr:DOMON-like domain-containing protein [Caulobacteraceae bacterium]
MHRVMVIHPSSRAPSIAALEAEATRPGPDQLRIAYKLTGSLGAVIMPVAKKGARADGLWRATCFEAFLTAGPGAGYLEFNFSPSTSWAAYAFSAYRAGMAPAALRASPRIDVAIRPDCLELSATVDLAGIIPREDPWRLGLCAVIEAADGVLSYWALAHPPGRPDFHDPLAFALDLPPTEHPCNSGSTA